MGIPLLASFDIRQHAGYSLKSSVKVQYMYVYK